MHLKLPEGMSKVPPLDLEYVIGVECPLFKLTRGANRYLPVRYDGSFSSEHNLCSVCQGNARVTLDNYYFPVAILPNECRKDETVWDKIADLVARIPRPKATKRVEATTRENWEKVK